MIFVSTMFMYPNMLKRLAKEKTLLEPLATLEEETGNVWNVRQGDYLVEFKFPSTYPFHAPYIRILEPVGILPRKGICGCSNGTLCVSGFLSDWGPSWTVLHVMERIQQLFEPDTESK
jgi:ubiquitin-protein ligase